MKRKPSNQETLRRLRNESEQAKTMTDFLDEERRRHSDRITKLETALAMMRDQSTMVAMLAEAVEGVRQRLDQEWVYHAQVRQVLQEAVNVHWPRLT